MSEKIDQPKTGGQFLLDSITNTEIFSREDFSEEHNDIYNWSWSLIEKKY